jgi:hypothetical protein
LAPKERFMFLQVTLYSDSSLSKKRTALTS